MEQLKHKIHRNFDRLLEAAIRYFDYYPERKAPVIAGIGFLLGCFFALVIFSLSYYLLKWFWLECSKEGGAVILFLTVAAYAAYVLRVR
jgi:hypothetical protein